jgi:hypothetical protein
VRARIYLQYITLQLQRATSARELLADRHNSKSGERIRARQALHLAVVRSSHQLDFNPQIVARIVKLRAN